MEEPMANKRSRTQGDSSSSTTVEDPQLVRRLRMTSNDTGDCKTSSDSSTQAR
ncbi:unnamed protein product, partial [Citrullus colocynthis]